MSHIGPTGVSPSGVLYYPPILTLPLPSEWSRMLTALSLPTPGEDDGRNAWWAALTKAVQERDEATVGIFADFCADKGWVNWERIAREQVHFMALAAKESPRRYTPGASG